MLNEFCAEVARNPLAQGVVLDLNEIWLTAWRLWQAGLNPDALVDLWRHPEFWTALALPFEIPEARLDESLDLNWYSHWADEVGRHLYGSRDYKRFGPYIVKAVARPASSSEDREARDALRRLVRETPFPAILETRPLARLVFASGEACRATGGAQGTIGGFLRDKSTGNVFAATCGHVASAGASVAVSGPLSGACVYSHAPDPLAGGVCAPGASHANKLDLALIDPGSAAVANTVSGHSNTIYPHDPLVMQGGQTGRARYEVGGTCLCYSPGGYCFEGLFEVRPPRPSGILHPSLSTALATVPTDGDSGSWVQKASTNEWAGMLVAADHLFGYALESGTVLSEGSAAFGLDLELL